MDSSTTFAQLREMVAFFISERNWQRFHTPKNVAMSIAIEAAELQEHFQWLTTEESQTYVQIPENRTAVADELADIMIYCLSFANLSEIDMSSAIMKKLKNNEKRFPVPSKVVEIAGRDTAE